MSEKLTGEESSCGVTPLHQNGVVETAAVPEYFARILKNKDRIIRVQAKRIEILESEVERLRLDREALNSQLAVVSYKLGLTNRAATVCGCNVRKVEQTTEHKLASVAENCGRIGSGYLSRQQRGVTFHASECSCQYHGIPVEEEIGSTSVDDVLINGNVTCCSPIASPAQFSASAVSAVPEQGTTNLMADEIVDELSSRYGGFHRARRAATIIQQTYRQYSMNRSFAKLRLEGGESRRSRRFGRKRIAGDGEIDIRESESGFSHWSHKADTVRSAGDENWLQDTQVVDAKSVSLNGNVEEVETSASDDSVELVNDGLSDDGGICSRSGSLSPLPPPMPPITLAGNNDLPSVCFENNLDNRAYCNVDEKFSAVDSSSGNASSCSRLHSVNSRDALTRSSRNTSGIPQDYDKTRKYFDFPEVSADTLGLYSNPPNFSQPANGFQESVCRSCLENFNLHQTSVSYFYHRHKAAGCVGCLTSHLPIPPTYTVPPASGDAVHDVSFASQGFQSTVCPSSIPAYSSFNIRNAGSLVDLSPIWKRKSNAMVLYDGSVVFGGNGSSSIDDDCRRCERPWSEQYPASTASSEDVGSVSSGGNEVAPMSSRQHYAVCRPVVESLGSDAISNNNSAAIQSTPSNGGGMCDRQRKRSYRIGLNLFNKRPDDGIRYLVSQKFVDDLPIAVARFLITRKGLSRQKIGEYLGNLQQRFNMDVLGCFAEEIDLSGMPVDEALRYFQSHFRMPGEAQKIERLMEAFSSCYCECNPDVVHMFHRADTVFLLAFAIIMLNTDLHNQNIKPERKMKLEDFIHNLRGIDGGNDISRDLLTNIYERTFAVPFKPAADHVTQVMKVEMMITGKKPVLALPHRRLVCYCRLYEVQDPGKRDRSSGQHQREVFLFNDVLMVFGALCECKGALLLRRFLSSVWDTVDPWQNDYQHGIQLTGESGTKMLGTFCARNERDRIKFVDDLRESILEMNEMVIIESRGMHEVLHTVGPCSNGSRNGFLSTSDFDARLTTNRLSAPECGGDSILPLRKSLTTSSLVDICEVDQSGSRASLDSGLPSTGSGSTASSQEMGHSNPSRMKSITSHSQQQQQLLLHPSSGANFGIFTKKTRPLPRLSPNVDTVVEF